MHIYIYIPLFWLVLPLFSGIVVLATPNKYKSKVFSQKVHNHQSTKHFVSSACVYIHIIPYPIKSHCVLSMLSLTPPHVVWVSLL